MDQKLGLIQEASEKFIRVLNKFYELEKARFDFGTEQLLSPSEIHTVVAIGKNKDINVTGLSKQQGITKGAVSQMLSKLEKKGLVQREKKGDSAREVVVSLTDKGQQAFEGHERFHYEMYVDFIQAFSIEEFAVLDKLTDKLEFFVDTYIKEGV